MTDTTEEHQGAPSARRERGRTVHGEAANAGHRVLAPDDAEVEAYLEQALHAPPPDRAEAQPAEPDTVVILDFGSQFAQLIARRVRELNREIATPAPLPPTPPGGPDFSTLSDGSQQWKNLEDIR